MLINKSIRTKDKDINAYIEKLEAEVESCSGSKSKQLIISIDKMAGKLSEDMDKIVKDGDGELSTKLVDTYLKMVKEAKNIKEFSQVVVALEKIPEEIKTGEEKEGEPKLSGKKGLVADENPFEQMQKKVTGKNG